jgi:hypothetical protein
MEKAGAAMKQIHGKLNIDTVDETMYVDELRYPARVLIQPLIHRVGRNSENNMRWEKRLRMPSHLRLLATLLMRMS